DQSREVEDDIHANKRFLHALGIAHITEEKPDLIFHRRIFEKAGRTGGIITEERPSFCSKSHEPLGEMTSDKSYVSGDQRSFVVPVHCYTAPDFTSRTAFW